MSRRIAAALAALLAVAGCTTDPSGADLVLEGLHSNPRHVEAVTWKNDDAHTGVTTVIGPDVPFTNRLKLHVFWLRGWLDPRDPAVHNRFQILVRARFPRRVYLKHAYSQGEPIGIRLIDAERVCDNGCEWHETVAIPLTLDELERLAGTGFLFEVLGRRDAVVVRVPAGYFSGFLAAFRRYGGG